MSAEVFPTQVRGLGHGISAACGKFGAVVSAIYFTNSVSLPTALSVCGVVNLVGVCATLLTTPELTRVPMIELEYWWAAITQGVESVYNGKATTSTALALVERLYWGRWRQHAGGSDGTGSGVRSREDSEAAAGEVVPLLVTSGGATNKAKV